MDQLVSPVTLPFSTANSVPMLLSALFVTMEAMELHVQVVPQLSILLLLLPVILAHQSSQIVSHAPQVPPVLSVSQLLLFSVQPTAPATPLSILAPLVNSVLQQ